MPRLAKPLTNPIIRRLPAPAKGNVIHWDTEVAGFGIRVTAGDARSFVLNYRTRNGRERRYTIGGWPDWTATAARTEARRLRHQVDQGGDPLADLEAEREAPTVGELCDRFEAEHLPRLRASSAADYKRMLNNHVRPHFGAHVKVQDVTFADIDALHRKITKAGHLHRANRTIAVVSKMFALAVRWAMRPDNPCKHVERNQETKRKRYLSADEFVRLTTALAAHPDKQAANIIRLLLLTGARRGEVLAAKWADIDLGTGTWTKPGATTKQKTDHAVPLSAHRHGNCSPKFATSKPASTGRSAPMCSPASATLATWWRSSGLGATSARPPTSPAYASTICATASPASLRAAEPVAADWRIVGAFECGHDTQIRPPV